MATTYASEQVTMPDPLWDDWEVPPRIRDSPELHLSGFDGPMDLLLDLAERQRIDLGQISFLQLAEQFLAEMKRLQLHVVLERRADWLVMASQLLLLRSRMLFPLSPEAEVAAAEDAERQVGRLDRMVFLRSGGPSPRVASYMALMEGCLFVLRGAEGQPGVEEQVVYWPAPPVLFRIDEAMARIRALIAGQGKEVLFERCLPIVTADDPLRKLTARLAVASSLIAVLELARSGELD